MEEQASVYLIQNIAAPLLVKRNVRPLKMNIKLCYLSFFVLIYDWIRLDLAGAEKVIGLDARTPLDDEDSEMGLVQKRFMQRAIDPLMRRSPLDKNFMRFGKRTEEKGHQDEKTRDSSEGSHEFEDILNLTPSEYKMFSEETEPKLKRIKQDFIRLGRGKQDFIRFGRGKQDFIRFGRGKQDFIRFGRGKQDFIRFGRSDLLHSRYPETNFDPEVLDDDYKSADDMDRDTRAKSSFIRFGRSDIFRPGRADNFIRFGRNAEIGAPADNINYRSKRSDEELRFARGGDPVQALFVADVNPVEIRRSSGFIRLGRSDRDATGSKNLEAGERRKRSVDATETTTAEPKVIVPKIGFKGLVVIPPETGAAPETDSEGGTGDETGNETGESTEKNELSDFPATELPEITFHIPSIRHKRRVYDLDKSKDLSIGPSMLENNLWEALASSSEYSPVARLRATSPDDYLVRIG